jgi:hypothetical protein
MAVVGASGVLVGGGVDGVAGVRVLEGKAKWSSAVSVLRLFPFDQFFFVDFDLGGRVRRLWAETSWVFFVLSHARLHTESGYYSQKKKESGYWPSQILPPIQRHFFLTYPATLFLDLSSDTYYGSE